MAGAEALLETAEGLFGDVLGERAGPGAGEQDARDRGVLECAVGERVAEGGFEIVGRVAFAQQQDLPGVVSAVAGHRGGERLEEGGRAGPHLLEGGA